MSAELHHAELEVVLRDQFENIGYGYAQPTRQDIINHLSDDEDVVGMYWCEKHAMLIECHDDCTEEMKPIYLVPANTGEEEE